MIKYLEGTVFNAPAKTLVNTVNCFGIMGAGIALEFKLRYPEMFEEYEVMCENKKMKTGIPRIYEYSENSFVCMYCNCFARPTDFQDTSFRTPVFRKTRSSGTQLFLHLMRYLPSSIKTKSAYISSGLHPVKLVVTGF